MRRNSIIGTLIVALTTLSAGPLSAQKRPSGFYAKIDITAEINTHSAMSAADFKTYLNNIYNDMLSNQAVSGLALADHWDQLNPHKPIRTGPSDPSPYDFKYLDWAFDDVATWNKQHPANPKNIQLIISPGMQSPQWLLDELTSCDPLFEGSTPPSDCGKVTFTGFSAEENDSDQLPLPWSTTYKDAWRAFLQELSVNKFGSNPLLASIAVAGPTAASEEMIMPNDNNTKNPETFSGGAAGPTYISPNEMWLELFEFHYSVMGVPEPEYQNSDQAFIEEWNNAIDMYGEIFSGLTLVVTTGSGLPDFTTSVVQSAPTSPIVFTSDCTSLPITMDCVAETTILSYFIGGTVGGSSNAKATQTSGVKSPITTVDLGLNGVKIVSSSTQTFSAPSQQILGGAQLNGSFSNNPMGEGGTVGNDVVQALYNILEVIFTDTQAGYIYCEPTSTMNMQPAPLNYVQIDSSDFQYAAKNLSNTVNTCGGPTTTTAQNELNRASLYLQIISEPGLSGLKPF
jgi:hypothetical protein